MTRQEYIARKEDLVARIDAAEPDSIERKVLEARLAALLEQRDAEIRKKSKHARLRHGHYNWHDAPRGTGLGRRMKLFWHEGWAQTNPHEFESSVVQGSVGVAVLLLILLSLWLFA